jgi:hypothetical protein
VAITVGTCAALTCNVPDSCNCWQGSIPVTPTGLGPSTLALTLNNDLNSLGNNGSNGVCRLMSGIGLITTKNGDKVNLSVTGSVCIESLTTVPLGFDGNFSVTGGTGKLASARGTGALDFAFYSAIFGTTSIDLVANGAFAKK